LLFLSQQRAQFEEENTRLKEFAEEFQKSLAHEKLTGKFSLAPLNCDAYARILVSQKCL